ncbi:hypothetical protein [Methylobacterium sp. JK268]
MAVIDIAPIIDIVVAPLDVVEGVELAAHMEGDSALAAAAFRLQEAILGFVEALDSRCKQGA